MISVILPTYKPGDYLERCLQSLGAQTLERSAYEVIIVLNGCCHPWHDYIKNLCDKYLSDTNVNLIQIDTPGVSNARNIGIDAAKGDYIAFVDDDDYISPTYLQSMAEKATPDKVIFTNCISFDDNSGAQDENYIYRRAYYILQDKTGLSHFAIRKLLNSPCMKLFPRNCIGDFRFSPKFCNGEDTLFVFTISRNFKGYDFTNDTAVYHRRIRSGSASTTRKKVLNRVANGIKLNIAFTKAYLENPFKYNMLFYMSRILAVAISSVSNK